MVGSGGVEDGRGRIHSGWSETSLTRKMVEGLSHETALIQTAGCGNAADESVRSLVGECCKMAHIHYKNGHDAMIDTVVHWEVCRKNGISVSGKW